MKNKATANTATPIKNGKVHIGKVIESYCTIKNISAEGLAELLGDVRQNVYRIYGNANIRTDRLEKICKILDYNFFAHYNSDKGNEILSFETIKREIEKGMERRVREEFIATLQKKIKANSRDLIKVNITLDHDKQIDILRSILGPDFTPPP